MEESRRTDLQKVYSSVEMSKVCQIGILTPDSMANMQTDSMANSRQTANRQTEADRQTDSMANK